MVESVRTRRAFSILSSSRTRGRSGPVWVVRARAPEAPDGAGAASPGSGARVAYAIGKAVGTAVVRNRIRRRLRALVDQLERDGALAPGLYLIGVTPAAVEESFTGLGDHLSRAVAGTR